MDKTLSFRRRHGKDDNYSHENRYVREARERANRESYAKWDFDNHMKDAERDRKEAVSGGGKASVALAAGAAGAVAAWNLIPQDGWLHGLERWGAAIPSAIVGFGGFFFLGSSVGDFIVANDKIRELKSGIDRESLGNETQEEYEKRMKNHAFFDPVPQKLRDKWRIHDAIRGMEKSVVDSVKTTFELAYAAACDVSFAWPAIRNIDWNGSKLSIAEAIAMGVLAVFLVGRTITGIVGVNSARRDLQRFVKDASNGVIGPEVDLKRD